MMPSEAWLRDDSMLSGCATKFYSLTEHGLCSADFDMLYDIASDDMFSLRTKPLIAEDYVEISRRPQRYEDGWFIEFFPTEVGERCRETLLQGLIWHTGAQAPAIRESVEHWFEQLAKMERPEDKSWDRLEKSTHPALKPCQDILVPSKIVAWIKNLRWASIGSSIFTDVLKLPKEYQAVRDFADQRIVELWVDRVKRIDRPNHTDFDLIKKHLTDPKFKPVHDEAFLRKMQVWVPQNETVPGP